MELDRRGRRTAPREQSADTPVEQATAEQLRRGALWGTARSVLLRAAGMLTTIAVVRVVSPEQFGIWAVALSVHAIVVNSAELGVTALLIRRDSPAAAYAPTARTLAMLSSATFAVAMAAAAPALAAGFGAPAATGVVRLMAIPVGLVGVFAVPQALLARDFRQRELFVCNVVTIVTANATLLAIALSGGGAQAFAWSVIVGQLSGGALALRLAGSGVRPGLDRAAARALLRFGAPLAVANAVNYAYLNLDYVVVGRTLGATALGVYLLAFNISSWPYAILGGTINSVTLPAFSEGDESTRQQRVEVGLQLVALIAFPIAALLAALAGPLVATVYGGEWSASAAVLAGLAPYGAGFLVTLTLGNLLVGAGRPGRLLWLQVLWLAVLAPTMWFLVRWVGLQGAAWAHVAVLFTVSGPAYLLATRTAVGIPVRAVLRSLAGPLLAALAVYTVARAAAALAPSPLLALLSGGLLAGVVYLVLTAPVLASRAHLSLTGSHRAVAGLMGRCLSLADRTGLDKLFLTRSQRWGLNAATSARPATEL